MLLDILLIVLRETLEASVLIGILLSIGRSYQIAPRWVVLALIIGGLGSWGYAIQMAVVSEWFDYAGLEVVSAALQYLIYLLLGFVALSHFIQQPAKRLIMLAMVIAVTVAVIREGSELYLFFSGAISSGQRLSVVLTSGFIGLCVGMSVGAIAYYWLSTRSVCWQRWLHVSILILIAAGMILQANQLLIQVDWLQVGSPVWDSGFLLPEDSVPGEIIYAIFGYESTPSATEVVLYLLAIGLIVLAIGLSKIWQRRQPKEAAIGSAE